MEQPYIEDGRAKKQNLEKLISIDTIQNYFSLKDIELFKMVFTENGENLRNNVAHCFLEYSNYDYQTALLVFFDILRLSKYKFVVQD